MQIRRISPIKLSYQIGGALTGLMQKSDNHRTKQYDGAFKWFSESSFMKCFSICQEILNTSQIAIAFHEICPPIFHPSQIATIRWTSLLLFCALLFRQFHSSRIDGVLKYDESMFDFWIFRRLRNFRQLLSVSRGVCVLHGHDRVRRVAKSCTTTAYRCLL